MKEGPLHVLGSPQGGCAERFLPGDKKQDNGTKYVSHPSHTQAYTPHALVFEVHQDCYSTPGCPLHGLAGCSMADSHIECPVIGYIIPVPPIQRTSTACKGIPCCAKSLHELFVLRVWRMTVGELWWYNILGVPRPLTLDPKQNFNP